MTHGSWEVARGWTEGVVLAGAWRARGEGWKVLSDWEGGARLQAWRRESACQLSTKYTRVLCCLTTTTAPTLGD